MAHQYKDSFFRSIFSAEKPLLDLYNALHNTRYDEQTPLLITTLSESLYSGQKNDLAFLLDRKLILMAEHQSTINENMPFRFLQPIGRIFENGISDKRTIYQKKRIALPRPEFIVLYNGKEPLAERTTLRLSDAFEHIAGFEEIKLELEVEVYNINRGYNEGIVGRSEELRGYVYFVDRVRYHEEAERRRGTPAEQVTLSALRKGIEDCKAAGLLGWFWERMTKEDERMLCEEWDWNLALEVSREEGWEKGREAGFEEGIEQGIEKGIEQGIERGIEKGIEQGIEKGIEKGIERGIKQGIERGIEEGIEQGIAHEQNRILELLTKGYTVEDIKRELTFQQET